MSQKNKDLISRWFDEVWNQGRKEAIFELYAPKGKAYGIGNEYSNGPQEFVTFWQAFRDGFTQIQFTIEEIMAEDNKVACNWSATMYHSGTFMDCQATNKHVTVSGMSLSFIQDHQIIRAINHWDLYKLLQQIQ